jgi:hypothetical protein
MLYKALHASSEPSRYVIQQLKPSSDMPPNPLSFGHYGYVLCNRLRHRRYIPTEEMEPDGRTPKPMVNIGLWGPAKADTFVSGISLVGGELFEVSMASKWVLGNWESIGSKEYLIHRKATWRPKDENPN